MRKQKSLILSGAAAREDQTVDAAEAAEEAAEARRLSAEAAEAARLKKAAEEREDARLQAEREAKVFGRAPLLAPSLPLKAAALSLMPDACLPVSGARPPSVVRLPHKVGVAPTSMPVCPSVGRGLPPGSRNSLLWACPLLLPIFPIP